MPSHGGLWRDRRPGGRPLVTAERAFLAELGGGCTLPVGAHAVPAVSDHGSDGGADPGSIRLNGLLASPDGLVVLRHGATGDRPEELGRAVARYLLDTAGGHDLGEWESVGTDGDADGRRPKVVR